ncbi:MAG: helix-turn-helix protein [Syntrophus sp. PtaB.Bin138]|nr:MAG: helix-turn-helix protein [Syntrophus sp. PtaB.Bin138]
MASKAFIEMIRNTMETDEFWVEKAILEFTSDIYQEMKRQNKTSSDLARILETSPAYITKIFRGNANFTIHSMVKLSRALGCRLHIKVACRDVAVRWPDFLSGWNEVTSCQWTASDNYRPVSNYIIGAENNVTTQIAA